MKEFNSMRCAGSAWNDAGCCTPFFCLCDSDTKNLFDVHNIFAK